MMKETKGLREPVVHGMLRNGETMTLIATPKVGKSWLAYSLAWSIVTGKKWLETFPTVPGDVLLIDNELHDETLADRIPQVADALNIPLDDYDTNLEVIKLRGKLKDLKALEPEFNSITHGRYSCIIIDALYRVLPDGAQENESADLKTAFNLIDAYAERTGAAIVLIHHSTKGNQAEKSVTDVGSGSGVMSRAADTHVVLREHEQEGAVVMEAVARSWPPMKPVCLVKAFPLWKTSTLLDPTALKRTKQRKPKEMKDIWTAQRFAEEFITDTSQPKAAIIDDAITAGLTERQANRLFISAMAKKLAFEHSGKCYATTAPATQAATNPATGNLLPATGNNSVAAVATTRQGLVKAALAEDPNASNRKIADKCGVSKEYVRQIRSEQTLFAAA